MHVHMQSQYVCCSLTASLESWILIQLHSNPNSNGDICSLASDLQYLKLTGSHFKMQKLQLLWGQPSMAYIQEQAGMAEGPRCKPDVL